MQWTRTPPPGCIVLLFGELTEANASSWLYRLLFGESTAIVVRNAHDALTDQADWDAQTWDMDRAKLKDIASLIAEAFALSQQGIIVQASWAGERPRTVENITIDQMTELVAQSKLGTRTMYRVSKGNANRLQRGTE